MKTVDEMRARYAERVEQRQQAAAMETKKLIEQWIPILEERIERAFESVLPQESVEVFSNQLVSDFSSLANVFAAACGVRDHFTALGFKALVCVREQNPSHKGVRISWGLEE